MCMRACGTSCRGTATGKCLNQALSMRLDTIARCPPSQHSSRCQVEAQRLLQRERASHQMPVERFQQRCTLFARSSSRCDAASVHQRASFEDISTCLACNLMLRFDKAQGRRKCPPMSLVSLSTTPKSTCLLRTSILAAHLSCLQVRCLRCSHFHVRSFSSWQLAYVPYQALWQPMACSCTIMSLNCHRAALHPSFSEEFSLGEHRLGLGRHRLRFQIGQTRWAGNMTAADDFNAAG